MTIDEDSDLLAQLLRPQAPLSGAPDAPDRLIRQGRRMVRRRRWATASGALALIVTVAAIVGVTGLFGITSAARRPTFTPVSPHVLSPVSGLVLGADQHDRFVMEDLADPSRARVLSVGPGATGPVFAGGIAPNPGQGWVVTYTSAAGRNGPAGTTRLAIVDTSGVMHPFGPVFPASTGVGGPAVAPDGSRVALLLAATSGTTPPTILVMPLPGHTGADRQWTVHDKYVNVIEDVSWAPDSRRLSYLAGTNTGAGVAGNPSTLDTSLPGDTIPTTSVPAMKNDCQIFAGTWLGVTGRYGAIAECPRAGATPETHFIEIDPLTAKRTHLGPVLPSYGCNENAIDSVTDDSRILLFHCGKLYLLAGGQLTLMRTSLLGFVWAGNSTGALPVPTPSVPATGIPTATPTTSGLAPPHTILAVLESPSPQQYGQPTLQPGTEWAGRTFTAKVPAGTTQMALSCGCGSGRQDPDPWGNYPLLTTDGHSWRVDGPEFGRGGSGHGSSLVANLLSLLGGGQLAWGRGANYVYVTHDLGAHWYAALIPTDYDTVTVTGKQLTLRVDHQQPGQTPYSYTSNDGGLTWNLNR